MSAPSRRRLFALASLLALFAPACKRKLPDATPEGVVRELVERMQRVRGEPRDARAAFELLSTRTQSNLASRAQRYAAASGKPIAPEAMLTPSRFSLHFDPQRFTTVERAGSWALVDVSGIAADQHAKIACVFEDPSDEAGSPHDARARLQTAGWRVELSLPPLPPVQLRPGATK